MRQFPVFHQGKNILLMGSSISFGFSAGFEEILIEHFHQPGSFRNFAEYDLQVCQH